MMFLAVLAIVLYLAIAALLFRKYLRTRDAAFIWLAAAVVVWPLISRLLLDPLAGTLINRLAHGNLVGFFPFTLVEHGQMSLGTLVSSFALIKQIIGICLLLVAVLYLSKTKSEHGRDAARPLA